MRGARHGKVTERIDDTEVHGYRMKRGTRRDGEYATSWAFGSVVRECHEERRNCTFALILFESFYFSRFSFLEDPTNAGGGASRGPKAFSGDPLQPLDLSFPRLVLFSSYAQLRIFFFSFVFYTYFFYFSIYRSHCDREISAVPLRSGLLSPVDGLWAKSP